MQDFLVLTSVMSSCSHGEITERVGISNMRVAVSYIVLIVQMLVFLE
jgi:hypothetical protein